nr:MAG TPA: hypothetical protein [Caudoviricetes sp.]
MASERDRPKNPRRQKRRFGIFRAEQKDLSAFGAG